MFTRETGCSNELIGSVTNNHQAAPPCKHKHTGHRRMLGYWEHWDGASPGKVLTETPLSKQVTHRRC